MTEEEMLGIADEKPAAAPETAETAPEAAEGGEAQLSREEVMAMCVRYEKARTPWADDAEAQQVATANLAGDDAQEYLAEVMAWHEAGEPEIAEEGEEAEGEGEPEEAAPAPKTEAQMLGIED